MKKITTQKVWAILVLSISATAFMYAFSPACCAEEVLKDALSPRKQYDSQLEWVYSGGLSSLDDNQISLAKAKISDVVMRFDTDDYIGRKVRIYLVLASQIDGYRGSDGFLLSWTADGFFSTGEVRPGNRSLIFEGVIDTEVISDRFTFILEVDANRLTGILSYAPIYTIEAD